MKKKFILVLLSLLYLTGCTTLEPLMRDVNVISIEQENAISQQMHAEIGKQMKFSNDFRYNKLVKKIGNQLVKTLPRRDFNYQFYVVEEDTANAFTIPGGRIYVHTGLIKFADSTDELAGVIAHEIGHAYERHPTKALTRQYGITNFAQRLFGAEPGLLQKMITSLAAQGILSRYGQSDEIESDHIGLMILQRSGYKQDGLLRFLEKLHRASRGRPTPPSFFASHPPTSQRIAILQKLLYSPKNN